MRKALVFDFDGTIADTLEAGRLIFNELAADFNIETIAEDELTALRHLTLGQFLKARGIKNRHVPSLLTRGRTLLRKHIADLQPCDGVPEVIDELRESVPHMGILTSNSVENVEIFLRTYNLRHHFDFISTCSKLKGKAKYLRGITRTFSLSPDDLIYIGDEVRDVRASKKAGIAIAAVTWGFNSAEALSAVEPDWLCDSPELLRELCA